MVWLISAIYFLDALVTSGIFRLPEILREVWGFDGRSLSARNGRSRGASEVNK